MSHESAGAMGEAVSWAEENQRELVRELERVRARIEKRDAAEAAGEPAALATLVRLFGLSPFERDVVLLCAGAEMDSRFAAAIAAAHGDPSRRAPTFGLALAALEGAHWSAITPAGPLRAWRLVEISGASPTAAPLRLEERVLHFLAGIQQLDDRLRGVVQVVEARAPGRADQDAVAARVAGELSAEGSSRAAQITGGDADARAAVVAGAAAALGASCLRVDASELPNDAGERFSLARLVGREALLGHAVIAIDATSDADGRRIASFGSALPVPWIVAAPDPSAALAGKATVFELAPVTASERLAVWESALGPSAPAWNGAIARVSAHFDLAGEAIRAAAARARAEGRDDALWDACRLAARPRLEG
ncbi:MAG TPA: ATP-binding protein, partial [Planctomycetota bacterium]|nr:ATP-binding protein [Planctomycetota bacterium]